MELMHTGRLVVEIAVTIVALLQRMGFIGIVPKSNNLALVYRHATDMGFWIIRKFRDKFCAIEKFEVVLCHASHTTQNSSLGQ